MMYAAVLAFLLERPVCYGERRDVPRLERIALAIVTVAADRSEAAALLTIGTAESAWCESVHVGRRRGWAGAGLWQLEPGSHRVPPFAGTDLDSTIHAAGEALWLWRHSHQFGEDLPSRFRAYGAQAPTWEGGKRRADLYFAIYARLGVKISAGGRNIAV